MADTITTGSILLAEGAVMPTSLLLESAPYSSGWLFVKSGAAELGRNVSKAGWTLFYMANQIKATVFGFDRARSIRTAVRRLIATTAAERFNCLEITHVVAKRFLGIPYVSVSAHSRQIERSMVLSAR